MSHPVAPALRRFTERYVRAWPRLTVRADDQWHSPCEVGTPDAGLVQWRPHEHDFIDHFIGLENALETTIHADVKDYFGTFWSSSMEATASQGHVSLIQLWNLEDADRLIENQIGHSLNKKRAKQPLSLFFACTEPDSELILTVHNESGEVLLENPGTRLITPLEMGLADFIDSLVPADPALSPDVSTS